MSGHQVIDFSDEEKKIGLSEEDEWTEVDVNEHGAAENAESPPSNGTSLDKKKIPPVWIALSIASITMVLVLYGMAANLMYHMSIFGGVMFTIIFLTCFALRVRSVVIRSRYNNALADLLKQARPQIRYTSVYLAICTAFLVLFAVNYMDLMRFADHRIPLTPFWFSTWQHDIKRMCTSSGNDEIRHQKWLADMSSTCNKEHADHPGSLLSVWCTDNFEKVQLASNSTLLATNPFTEWCTVAFPDIKYITAPGPSYMEAASQN